MARDGRKSKVLVVDDERNVLLTYKILLEQQGYETIASLTAKEGIGLIEKQDFDLLLCDLSLEEKRTGFEVIQAARSRSRTVPAVLLTGYASPERLTTPRRMTCRFCTSRSRSMNSLRLLRRC